MFLFIRNYVDYNMYNNEERWNAMNKSPHVGEM